MRKGMHDFISLHFAFFRVFSGLLFPNPCSSVVDIPTPPLAKSDATNFMKRLIVFCLFATNLLLAQEKDKDKDKEKEKPKEAEKPAVSIFPDKNLETAVRKFVFEKRDND